MKLSLQILSIIILTIACKKVVINDTTKYPKEAFYGKWYVTSTTYDYFKNDTKVEAITDNAPSNPFSLLPKNLAGPDEVGAWQLIDKDKIIFYEDFGYFKTILTIQSIDDTTMVLTHTTPLSEETIKNILKEIPQKGIQYTLIKTIYFEKIQ